MEINQIINSKIQEELREEILKADGNEVFFRGILDENRKVYKIDVLARGNNHSVPAILKTNEKRRNYNS